MSERITYLTLIEEVGKNNAGHRLGRYKCVCGTEKILPMFKVWYFKTKSCGCLKAKLVSKATTKHGLRQHPLYKIWRNIKSRCNVSTSPDYKNYGGRGVRMCEEWENDFMAFYNWAISNGWKKGLDVDKDSKGNNLLYSPLYCTILTHKDNCNNTRANKFIVYNGKKQTVAQWAEEARLPPQVLLGRIISGWDMGRAISTPAKSKIAFRSIICANTKQVFSSINQAAKELHINKNAISFSLKNRIPVKGLLFNDYNIKNTDHGIRYSFGHIG